MVQSNLLYYPIYSYLAADTGVMNLSDMFTPLFLRAQLLVPSR